MKVIIRYKGGKGSGFRGHKGRPGKVGGSSTAGGTVYHGTSKVSYDITNAAMDELIQSVTKEGLKKGKRWHGRDPSVYITENPEIALGYALERATNRLIEKGYAIKGVVFEVEVPSGVEMIEDTKNPGIIGGRDIEGKSYRLPDNVPPEWIKGYKVYELDYDKYMHAHADEKMDAFSEIDHVVLKQTKVYIPFIIMNGEVI